MPALSIPDVTYLGGHPRRPDETAALTAAVDRSGIVLRRRLRRFLTFRWPDLRGLAVGTPGFRTMMMSSMRGTGEGASLDLHLDRGVCEFYVDGIRAATLREQLASWLVREAGPPELVAVEDALRAHPIAHFACHAEADASAAAMLRGGLRLGGGGTLSPSMVGSYHLERAELAFLSACSTAETHPTFTDEPLHLAAAFQLAGFRGVVGTTWHTTDSARIAEAFYAGLTNGGTQPPDPAAAARVLNDAVRAVRDEFPATPTRWAGHLHVGVNRPL